MRVNGHKRERRLIMFEFDAWDPDLESFYCGEFGAGPIPWPPGKAAHFNRVFHHPRTVAWQRTLRLPRDVGGDPYLLRFMRPSVPMARPERHAVHKWAYLGQADWPLGPAAAPQCTCAGEVRRLDPNCPVHGGQK
jgi:hypothetical protein